MVDLGLRTQSVTKWSYSQLLLRFVLFKIMDNETSDLKFILIQLGDYVLLLLLSFQWPKATVLCSRTVLEAMVHKESPKAHTTVCFCWVGPCSLL